MVYGVIQFHMIETLVSITFQVLILTPFVVPYNLAPFMVTPETKDSEFPDPKLPILSSPCKKGQVLILT